MPHAPIGAIPDAAAIGPKPYVKWPTRRTISRTATARDRRPSYRDVRADAIQARFLAFPVLRLWPFLVSALAVRLPPMGSSISFWPADALRGRLLFAAGCG